jgi:hypothetical protein
MTDAAALTKLAKALATVHDAAAAALAYAEAGFAVLPFEALPNGGKRPIGKLVPHGVYSASRDPETIRQWLKAFPGALIAVVMPESFLAIDYDCKHGKRGDLSFAKAHGAAPSTVETATARTATGGGHVWLRANGKAYTTKHAIKINGATLDGLEVIAAGAAIIMPAPGTGYYWEKPLSAGIADAFAWVPDASDTAREGESPAATGERKPFIGAEPEWTQRELELACGAIANGGPATTTPHPAKRFGSAA